MTGARKISYFRRLDQYKDNFLFTLIGHLYSNERDVSSPCHVCHIRFQIFETSLAVFVVQLIRL